MDKKKSFGEALESFFAGKGFYIVLILCVAVIGISAWTMLAAEGNEPAAELPLSLSEGAENTGEAPLPAAAPDDDGEEAAEVSAPAEEDKPEGIPASAPLPSPSPAPAPAPAAPETVPSYFIPPVAGEVENGYSMDALQYNRTMRDWRTHDGLDIAAELGAQVKAVADGRVERVYSDEALGTTVVLLHSGGLRSIYANLAESPTVSEGDAVATGSVIGSVGTTALGETGEVNHLHFAMSLNGKSVDPGDYLP